MAPTAKLALIAVRAGLGVDALLGQAQSLDGPAAHQVLIHDLRGVTGLHMAVPDGVGIDHNRWPMFALVQAKGFVDAYGGAESGGFGQLLQLGEELTFAVRGAGRARRIGRTSVVADKNVMLKRGQAVFLLDVDDWFI
jgi:hypothetical protein